MSATITTPVYLDYAATAAIRPPEVVDAIAAYLRDVGATPGRSGHLRALEAGRTALRCRRLIAELLGIEGDPGRIVFQLNATHALNTALHGVLNAGDRVVRTPFDHNAVVRPVAALRRAGVLESVVGIDQSGRPDMAELDHLLHGDGRAAKLLTIPHASNVTGVVLPVREMAERARAVGALVLVDLAQTAGHYPVDLSQLGVDLAAFTGHKGLLGPQGIGGLWVRDGVEVEPLLRGGTGGDSVPSEMPAAYPDHLEAGTQNAPGIAGLAAACEWLLRHGVDTLCQAELNLKQRLIHGLRAIQGVRICSVTDTESVGIVTLIVDGLDAAELAHRIERSHGIQARAGLHCAPGAHGVIGTLRTGALRLSLGWASTPADVDRAIDALKDVAGENFEL